jgi:hypothetical protein
VGDVRGSVGIRETGVGGNEAVVDGSITFSICGTKVKTEINQVRRDCSRNNMMERPVRSCVVCALTGQIALDEGYLWYGSEIGRVQDGHPRVLIRRFILSEWDS